ncbi:archease [Leptolyngbya sp. FACHB-261]|uniref:archease n=1 Tax=Leptolyngbya sp. FACHB-261 TaxID=2692806 RepID=UPI001684D273|nr:archease [Leptolyngbya sp. FACHB-261]MBD2100291.1 archease [Leptolyngbya sp. FACHB-261]
MDVSQSSQPAGFTEIDHTADWSYRVWAPNPEELFIQAAQALYQLADTHLVSEPRIEREIHLRGTDYESLLVAWLNELLYLGECEGLGFDHFEISALNAENFQIQASGAPVQNWSKVIKAVTYSNLSIDKTETGLEATLVLDV